jgi:hypothetical protein
VIQLCNALLNTSDHVNSTDLFPAELGPDSDLERRRTCVPEASRDMRGKDTLDKYGKSAKKRLKNSVRSGIDS